MAELSEFLADFSTLMDHPFDIFQCMEERDETRDREFETIGEIASRWLAGLVRQAKKTSGETPDKLQIGAVSLGTDRPAAERSNGYEAHAAGSYVPANGNEPAAPISGRNEDRAAGQAVDLQREGPPINGRGFGREMAEGGLPSSEPGAPFPESALWGLK